MEEARSSTRSQIEALALSWHTVISETVSITTRLLSMALLAMTMVRSVTQMGGLRYIVGIHFKLKFSFNEADNSNPAYESSKRQACIIHLDRESAKIGCPDGKVAHRVDYACQISVCIGSRTMQSRQDQVQISSGQRT